MCVLATKEGKRFSLYKGDKLSPIRLVPVELRSNNEIERGEKKRKAGASADQRSGDISNNYK